MGLLTGMRLVLCKKCERPILYVAVAFPKGIKHCIDCEDHGDSNDHWIERMEQRV